MVTAKKPAAAQQAPRPNGRPRTEIDLVQVERLATIQCTDQEIAAVIGVHVNTIARRKQDDPAFLQALTDGRAKGIATLRRVQYQRATGGSDTMLIWLGKNLMGQTDKQTLSGDPANPVQMRINFVRPNRTGSEPTGSA